MVTGNSLRYSPDGLKAIIAFKHALGNSDFVATNVYSVLFFLPGDLKLQIINRDENERLKYIMTGKLITFEGIDLCGKSAQIDQLIANLKFKKVPFIVFREPGGTIIAEKIRYTLLAKEQEVMSPVTEYLLYSAARAQLVKEQIIPSLEQGLLVICDRYYDSSTAYQGYGRDIDLKVVNQINYFATNGIRPNLTFLIDIDLNEMERRKKLMNKNLDRMEDQDGSFFEKVRNGYLRIAAEEPERFYVIDGKRTIHLIAKEIWGVVKRIMMKSEK